MGLSAVPPPPPGTWGTATAGALILLALVGLFLLGDGLHTLSGGDQLRAVGWGLALTLIPGGLLAIWFLPPLARLGWYAMVAGATSLGLAVFVGLLLGADTPD